MNNFCPKCGGIMRVVGEDKKEKKIILRCTICGYEKKVSRIKKRTVAITPAENEEELGEGVIQDKELPKIKIDEDTVKEALDLLGGSD